MNKASFISSYDYQWSPFCHHSNHISCHKRDIFYEGNADSWKKKKKSLVGHLS